MRKLPLLLACAAALALGACANHPAAPGTQPPAIVRSDPALSALIAAETAFNAAANAELDAKATGLLAGAKAAQADDIRHRAYAALLAMRTAYQAGQAFDPAQLITLTNQLLVAAGKLPAGPAQPK